MASTAMVSIWQPLGIYLHHTRDLSLQEKGSFVHVHLVLVAIYPILMRHSVSVIQHSADGGHLLWARYYIFEFMQMFLGSKETMNSEFDVIYL